MCGVDADKSNHEMEYNVLYELVKNMKKDLTDEECMKKMDKLTFKDSSGMIDLDNFTIAAKNGVSILDKPVFESKRLGKLIEGHYKERI